MPPSSDRRTGVLKGLSYNVACLINRVCLFPSELYTAYCCFCHFYGSAHKLEQFLSLYLCFLWFVSLSFYYFFLLFSLTQVLSLFVSFYIYLFLVLCFLHSRSFFRYFSSSLCVLPCFLLPQSHFLLDTAFPMAPLNVFVTADRWMD